MTSSLQFDAFLEALDDGDRARWRIRIIRAGLSKNGNFYSDGVLAEAAPLFEGARVLLRSDEEHLKGAGKHFMNVIGRLTGPVFRPGAHPDTGELQATFELLQPSGAVAARLRDAWARGMSGLFGFSIDAEGEGRIRQRGGRRMRLTERISKVNSVDLIVEPGAGGGIISLIEAKRNDPVTREEMLNTIVSLRPDLLEGKDLEALSDEDVEAFFKLALESQGQTGGAAMSVPAQPMPGAPAGGMTEALAMRLQALEQRAHLAETRAMMREAISGSTLPPAAKEKLSVDFARRAHFTEAEVRQAIREEAAYLARFVESGRVTGLGDLPRIEAGESRAEKTSKMLDACFDPNDRSVQSLRECYVAITGDKRITGATHNCDRALLREALDGATLGQVLGNAITRRMIADYNTADILDVWRNLAQVVPVNDFRTQERLRWGGYGDLPAVAESGGYAALASPGDEKTTYAVSKFGGTEQITLEMIVNDDMSVVQQIPRKLARAAKRTLSKFVIDLMATDPVIYDGLTLFHVNHANVMFGALSEANYAAARLLMVKQTEFGTTEPLHVNPKYLWVPAELEQASHDIFKRGQDDRDQSFVQTLRPEVVPVWYWTDQFAWFVTADWREVPTIEVGFLGGCEEPELFVQDTPAQGSMFANDTITYKIRHIYGGAVLDYRGFVSSTAAAG
jgi:hypothetical protein